MLSAHGSTWSGVKRRKAGKEDSHTAARARANTAPAKLSGQGCKRGKRQELAQQPQRWSKTFCQDAAVGARPYLAAPGQGVQGSRGKLRKWGSPVEGATSHESEHQPPAGSRTETELVRFFSKVKTRSKQINIARNKWHRRVQFSLKMMGKKAVLMSEVPAQHFCCQVKQAGRC